MNNDQNKSESEDPSSKSDSSLRRFPRTRKNRITPPPQEEINNEAPKETSKEPIIRSPRDTTIIQVRGEELDRASLKPIMNNPEASPRQAVPIIPKVTPRITPRMSPKASPKIINITENSTSNAQLISSPVYRNVPIISPRVPSPEEEILQRTIESGSRRKHSIKKPSRRHSDQERKSPILSFRDNPILTPQLSRHHSPIFESIRKGSNDSVLDDLSHLDNLSADDEAYLRDEYDRKFEVLRKKYKGITIPPVRQGEPIKNIVRRYDRWIKYFKQSYNANIFRILLVVYFLFLESVCNKILGLKGEDFTNTAVNLLTEYDDMLMELGERDTLSNFGSWPVEARILLLGLFHMTVYLILQYLANWIGKENSQSILDLFVVYARSSRTYDPENPDEAPEFNIESMIARVGSIFARGNNGNNPNTQTNNQQNSNKQEENKQTYRPRFNE